MTTPNDRPALTPLHSDELLQLSGGLTLIGPGVELAGQGNPLAPYIPERPRPYSLPGLSSLRPRR